ncbi:MAG: hypothetical protein SPF17_07525 [Candidatus Mucispirillum faecigallinarum]|nr:hypothetical protein [Candidatus Mucispirillum faecigallinarum]
MLNRLLIFVSSFIFIFCVNQFSYAVTFEQKIDSESERTSYTGIFKNTNIEKVYDELILNTDSVVQGEFKGGIVEIIGMFKDPVEEVANYYVSYDGQKAVLYVAPYEYSFTIKLTQNGQDVAVSISRGY